MSILIGLMLLITVVASFLVLGLDRDYSKRIALFASGVVLAITILILITSLAQGSVSLSEQYNYVSAFGISLQLQMSAINFILVLMTTIVAFGTVLAGNPEHEHEKVANTLILLFEFAAIGLFTSANLFVFFIFWDVGVVALFFMINSLGSPNRRYASMKFIIYEIFASSLLLLGIMMIYFYTPVHSFNIQTIISSAASIPEATQAMIFFFLFVAFMVNMPMFPLHFWLPDAHTEASTQGSMLLSGVLTKFGAFGMLLLFSILPISREFAAPAAALAGFSTLYAAFVTMRQKDIKRVIAYTTIIDMGIILVAIASMNEFGTYGALFGMFAHGVTIALMFLVVGCVHHIFGTRDMRSVKGVVNQATSTAYSFLAGTFGITGVPLTTGFVADVLIFIGSIQAFGIIGALPLLGLLIIGAFLYFVINKSFLMTKDPLQRVDYIGVEQKIGYAFFMFFMFLFGVFPFLLLGLTNLQL
jgi:NADH-quinone oxidoreductase subunit M